MRAGPATVGALLAFAALALGGCGGGQGSATTSAGSGPRVLALKVSGSGSAQFRTRGGDNSIQGYGSEAGHKELRRAAQVLHAYFAALAREDWGGACSHLSREELGNLKQLSVSSAKFKDADCAHLIGKLFGKVSAAAGREATTVDAAGLRREGAQGFLIYRGAHGRPYFVSMRRQGGGWVVAGLSPTALP